MTKAKRNAALISPLSSTMRTTGVSLSSEPSRSIECATLRSMDQIRNASSAARREDPSLLAILVAGALGNQGQDGDAQVAMAFATRLEEKKSLRGCCCANMVWSVRWVYAHSG